MLTLAILGGVLSVVLGSRWLSAKKRAETLSAELEQAKRSASSEIDSLRARIRDAEASVARLAQYQTIVDAEARAAEILADASAIRAQAVTEASEVEARSKAERARLLERAQTTVSELLAQARSSRDIAEREAREIREAGQADARANRAAAADQAKKAGAEADRIVTEANARADAIVANANARAQEVAGDALRALNEAQALERTVRALENRVDGYGDRYLIPSHTLLDDLAEGFGHTEAGQKLKAAREHVRNMIRLGRAASCDYVETERKTTAIRFVLDAFNGQVDAILAEVRYDNAGTLAQQIRDAFTLVNVHGKAFRNARITDEYLAGRLEELQWAAVAHQLKLEEREEQRRIKEQIREEEKARREYERAIKDAAREEDMLKKAMAKAEEQMAKASDSQRAKYEEQLAALSAKLAEAEARNQRAVSMAQQTRRGHVYIISNIGSLGEHVYKIGLTRRLDPQERIRELGDSSVPFEFDVHALIFSDDAPALEHQLHKHFVLNQVNKVNHRKEFFRTELAYIRAEIEKLGLATQWTMTATAREYRESLTIEATIRDNPAARDAWIRRQLLLDAVSDPFESDEVTSERPTADAGSA